MVLPEFYEPYVLAIYDGALLMLVCAIVDIVFPEDDDFDLDDEDFD